MTRRLRLLRWLAADAAVAVLLATALAVAPAPPGAAASSPVCGPMQHVLDAKGQPVPPVDARQPVLLVHGFNGSPSGTWTGSGGIAAELEAPGSGFFVGRFDYSYQDDLNEQWVTDTRIAGTSTQPGQLADVIDCMAQESRHAGGSGKVIVVGYSLGGLAAQQAISERVGGREVAGDVGGLVSIGTPWQGLDPKFDLATVLTGYYCDVIGPSAAAAPSISGDACLLLTNIGQGSPAAQAVLAVPGSGPSAQLKGLPKIPAGFPVLAVAGNVTWTAQQFDRSSSYQGSDWVVSVSSATSPPLAAGSGSGQLAMAVISCAASNFQAAPIHNKTSSPPWALIPCFHVTLPTDPAVAQQVFPVLRQWRTSLAERTPTWTAEEVAPGPITSVSCSGLFCAAVGATGTPGHGHGYALAYQAGAWSKPVPLGTGDSYTVSCPTATYCAAVTDTGYAYALQGGTWSGPVDIYPVANIQPSSTDAIEDLSCATPRFCVAVTAMGDALTWNGSVWSPPGAMGLPGMQPPLFPGDLSYVSVSCPTPVFCLAGTGNSGTGPSTAVAATWNGTGWTGISAGPVSGPDWKASCVNAAFCMVSGGYHAVGDISSIWNGTSWSGLAQPTNEGAALGFNQASCPRTGFCVAVDGGAHVNGSSAGDRYSGIFNWSNDTWNGPDLLDAKGYLGTVSCSTSGLCAAADSSGNIFVNPDGEMPTQSPAQADSCTVAQLSQAISAANPTVPSGWTVTKYACEGGYAIVEVYLSSAGNGYAVLKQEPSGWHSIYGLDDGTCLFGGCGGNFQLPLPAALLKTLMTKAGISQ